MNKENAKQPSTLALMNLVRILRREPNPELELVGVDFINQLRKSGVEALLLNAPPCGELKGSGAPLMALGSNWVLAFIVICT